MNLEIKILPRLIAPTLLRLTACLTLLVSVVAQAIVVTEMGDNVLFTYDNATKFGAGTVVGNTISFNPNDFRADSNINGAPSGFGFDSDILDIIITVLDGQAVVLDSIITTESGDYTLFGADTWVSASLYTAVDSLTNTDPISESVVNTGNIASPQDNTTTLWGLTNMNDWSWGGETSVEFRIQNNLTSYAPDGQFAWIQKKDGTVGIEVQVIPVPGAVWLMFSALMGLLVTKKIRA